MQEKDEKWALFWCGLLREAIYGEIPARKIHAHLRELSRKEVLFPDGVRRKPSLSTLKRKWKLFRLGGFKALARRRRRDRGRKRNTPAAMIERAVELKKEQPLRTEETIRQFLIREFARTIPRSTLYRILKEAGATRIKLGVARSKVRCRWTYEHTHDLWVGDFSDGPYVLADGEPARTHLSAFIDCHSRFIVEARYYVRENLDVLIDSFLRALAKHGAPARIYVDNAKIYHANALKAACYALNIRLLHRPPRDAPPGGLVERWFQTVQKQLESEVRATRDLSLDRLNQALAAWLSVSYHRREHSETDQTPEERYRSGLGVVRSVDLDEALSYFLRREQRTVHKDFSDISLDKRLYRVDPRLRGDRIEVRMHAAPMELVGDPAASGRAATTITVSETGRSACP